MDAATINEDFAAAGVELRSPEGTPNIAARDSIRITDTAPIIRMVEGGAGDLVQRRWSWPGPGADRSTTSGPTAANSPPGAA
ncbi:hypothetical protein [Inquilinus sp. CA228]|uniref:hypothetical protein n=1 Tax=Inquilinus sp. CA228 TaxID=3455609 RepID=UPI003F8D674E